MKIKILGTGCPGCKKLELNTKEALKQIDSKIEVEKITDLGKIMEYGVMSLPALVINKKVVSYGKILSVNEIKELIK